MVPNHALYQTELNPDMVEMTGIEPATSCVQGRRSPKLSYIPI